MLMDWMWDMKERRVMDDFKILGLGNWKKRVSVD